MFYYCVCALLGAMGGGVAAFFNHGGLANWRTFFHKVEGAQPFWRKNGVLIISGSLIGIYGNWLFHGFNSSFVGFLLLASCLLSATATDIRNHVIHMDSLLFFVIASVIYLITFGKLGVFLNGLLGGGVGLLILGIPHLIRSHLVGLGDVWLLGVCGLLTGFPGVIYLMLRAMIAIALFSFIQLLRKKMNVHSEVPLAPFLLLGALI